jgi:DNA repair exonuclease SbcCD ATPase subunit
MVYIEGPWWDNHQYDSRRLPAGSRESSIHQAFDVRGSWYRRHLSRDRERRDHLMPAKLNRADSIAEVERIVSHLRIFEHAAEVVKQAHADEAEIQGRQRRLEALAADIEDAQADLDAKKEEAASVVRKKEEDIQQLEEEQRRRVVAATERASRDITDAEARRRNKINSVNTELRALETRLQKAREETEAAEAELVAAKRKKDEFIRSVTR